MLLACIYVVFIHSVWKFTANLKEFSHQRVDDDRVIATAPHLRGAMIIMEHLRSQHVNTGTGYANIIYSLVLCTVTN